MHSSKPHPFEINEIVTMKVSEISEITDSNDPSPNDIRSGFFMIRLSFMSLQQFANLQFGQQLEIRFVMRPPRHRCARDGIVVAHLILVPSSMGIGHIDFIVPLSNAFHLYVGRELMGENFKF